MTSEQFAAVMKERDAILVSMDVDKAKAFIAEHGGAVPRSIKDWERVLHLARFECVKIDHRLRVDSQIYLATTGAQSVDSLPPNSPYLRAAMDLLFPVDTFEAYMAETVR